jgi:hypothetical protein
MKTFEEKETLLKWISYMPKKGSILHESQPNFYCKGNK